MWKTPREERSHDSAAGQQPGGAAAQFADLALLFGKRVGSESEDALGEVSHADEHIAGPDVVAPPSQPCGSSLALVREAFVPVVRPGAPKMLPSRAKWPRADAGSGIG